MHRISGKQDYNYAYRRKRRRAAPCTQTLNTGLVVVGVFCAFVSVLQLVCLADVRLVESVYVLCTRMQGGLL